MSKSNSRIIPTFFPLLHGHQHHHPHYHQRTSRTPAPAAPSCSSSLTSSSSTCTNTRSSSTTTSTSSTRTYQNHHHTKRQTSSTKHQTSSTMHQTSTTGEPAPAPVAPAAPAPAAPARPPPTAAPAPSTRPVAPSIQMPKFLQKALLERGLNEVRTRFERGPNQTLEVSQTRTAYPAKKTHESSHIPCKGGWLKCYFVTALAGESCFSKFGLS